MTPPDWAAHVAARIGDPTCAKRIEAGALAFDRGERSEAALWGALVREAYFAGATWAAGAAREILDSTAPPGRARR
jgi:hypothetical protein